MALALVCVGSDAPLPMSLAALLDEFQSQAQDTREDPLLEPGAVEAMRETGVFETANGTRNGSLEVRRPARKRKRGWKTVWRRSGPPPKRERARSRVAHA